MPEWRTVHGLMENAIYGGRVDDPFDFRVLKAYLARYFTSAVITGKQELLPERSDMRLPSTNVHADYAALIEKLPDSDLPNFFGLPDNIERSVQRTASAQLQSSLRTVEASSVAADQFNREEWKKQLGPMLEMWQKVCTADLKQQPADQPADQLAQMTPVDAFAIMENKAAWEMLMLVENDLSSLRKILFGSGLLTPQVRAYDSGVDSLVESGVVVWALAQYFEQGCGTLDTWFVNLRFVYNSFFSRSLWIPR
jgi:dynein heavy chain 2